MEILLIILAFLFGLSVGAVLGYYLLRYVATKAMEKQAAKMASLFTPGGGNTPIDPFSAMNELMKIMTPPVKKDG